MVSNVGVPGYKTQVYLSAANNTALTSEAMNKTTAYSLSFKEYQITNTAKRVLERSSTATLKVVKGASTYTTVGGGIVSVDYLFGKIVLTTASSTGAAATKVTGFYKPMSAIAGAHSYTLNQSAVMLDDTDYSNVGYVTKTPGLYDVTINLDRYDVLDITSFNLVNNGKTAVVEVDLANGSEKFRCFVKAQNRNGQGAVAGLETNALTFTMKGTAGYKRTFSWGN